MRVTISLCVLLFAQTVAASELCSPLSAQSDADMFLKGVFDAAFTPECRSKLIALNAPPSLLEECDIPFDARDLELHQRTERSVIDVSNKENSLMATIRFRGPSQKAYLKAKMDSTCSTQSPDNLLWPDYKKSQKCGDTFWSDIPIETYSVQMPLQCVAGKWIITK